MESMKLTWTTAKVAEFVQTNAHAGQLIWN
jgi:hypothetical protein